MQAVPARLDRYFIMNMKRALLFAVLLLTALAGAQEMYLGIYMSGQRIGYSSFIEAQDSYQGKPAKRTDSTTVISAGMLGTAMTMKISSTSWFDGATKPLRMKFVIESGGRTQVTDAIFAGNSIQISSDNNGQKSTKSIAYPKDAPVVEDPMLPMLNGDPVAGAKKTFYVLDPMTLTLVKNSVQLKGPAKTQIQGKDVSGTLIEVEDPRATMKVYVSAKGDFLKGEGPMGMEMIPISKEEALGQATESYKPSADLAFSTSIKTDKPITDADALKRLVLRITGRDLSRLPSDEHQTVTKESAGWKVDVHPPVQNVKTAVTIAKAAGAQGKWTKPSTHVSSDDPKIRALSKQIVGSETNVLKAALKIKAYVQKTMRPNAGIGVLRDATEIMRTKEGVCRDYAIFTASLMRAANIPTKLASGLVNWNGTFFYHAWVEIWDGKRWIGLDATVPTEQISPAHVKLAEGNVEDAFVFTFLDKVKIEVLSAQRK
jgi:hypothetical protein